MLEVAGRYFDGASAAKHDVTVRLDEAERVLRFEGVSLPRPEVWALDDLRLLADEPAGGWLTFTRHHAGADETERHEARISIADGPMNARLKALAPRLKRRDVRRGTGRKVAFYSIGAALAVALMLFVILPAMATSLAQLMPREREVQIGKAVVNQMHWMLAGDMDGRLLCKGAEGQAALETMERRLTERLDLEYELEIVVFDHEMVNAFAAPGGQIVILRGLLDDAKSADGVAGVLAHEIGHVEHRDSLTSVLRTAGSAGLLSMVVGDFSGGALAVLVAEQMINSSYTREAESRADDFALHALGEAEVNAEGLAEFFDYILELQGDVPDGFGYFMSHPPSDARAAKAREAAAAQGATRPVLSEDDWAALKGICKE